LNCTTQSEASEEFINKHFCNVRVSSVNGVWCTECIIFFAADSYDHSIVIKNSIMKFIYDYKSCFKKCGINCADL
jgi:hypothetical protein